MNKTNGLSLAPCKGWFPVVYLILSQVISNLVPYVKSQKLMSALDCQMHYHNHWPCHIRARKRSLHWHYVNLTSEPFTYRDHIEDVFHFLPYLIGFLSLPHVSSLSFLSSLCFSRARALSFQSIRATTTAPQSPSPSFARSATSVFMAARLR